jgi:hypothetical protein
MTILLVAINGYFINGIDGYYIISYNWFYMYITIIGDYFIINYCWIFYVMIL